MNPWRRRPNEPPKADESISLEDIEWRIGASDVKPPHEGGEPDEEAANSVWIGEEEAAAAAAATEQLTLEEAATAEGAAAAAAAAAAALEANERPPVTGPSPAAGLPTRQTRKKAPPRRGALQAHPVPVPVKRTAPIEPHAHPVGAATPRRLTLWRDVSALLFGVVAIVLIAQLALGNKGEVATASSSPGASSGPTDVAVIATGTPAPTAEVTIGPVINPSLIPVIQATPTPVPIITKPPATAPPAKPTQPTVTVPPVESVPPPPPTVPPPTPPVAHVVASATCGSSPITVDFDATTSTDATSWDWNFDDGTTGSGATVSHTFTADATQTLFSVILKVTGPGGLDSASVTITAGPCP